MCVRSSGYIYGEKTESITNSFSSVSLWPSKHVGLVIRIGWSKILVRNGTSNPKLELGTQIDTQTT